MPQGTMPQYMPQGVVSKAIRTCIVATKSTSGLWLALDLCCLYTASGHTALNDTEALDHDRQSIQL